MLIIGALLLVGITVFLILQPILSGMEAPLGSSKDQPSEAQFKKRVSLLQLRDAEYEYAMGKLGEEDYQTLRREISGEALAAIKVEETEAEGVGAGRFEGPTDAELEAEIALVRTRLTGGVFCSACGHPNPAGSRFCGECGDAVQTPETPAGP
jgi:cytochrome c-type biogenesis protein CcmI